MNRIRTVAPVLMLVAIAALACREGAPLVDPPDVAGGDVDRGRVVALRVGCGGCHVIPGLSGADGLIGPPLTDFAERTYIAGRLVNHPDSLVLWLMDPQVVEPNTAMPDLNLSEQNARDVAAFLYSLGGGSELGPPRLFPADWLRKIPGLGGH